MPKAYEVIRKILRTTDPEVAFGIFEDKVNPSITSRALYPSIEVRCDAFGDEDFLAVVQNHKRRLAKLRELRVSEAYFDLLALIEKTIVTEVVRLEAVGKADVVKVAVEYAPNTLKGSVITVKRSSRECRKCPVVRESTLGRHVIYVRPWDSLDWEVRGGNNPQPVGREQIREAVASGSWMFRRTFANEIDRHLLGEELAGPWR